MYIFFFSNVYIYILYLPFFGEQAVRLGRRHNMPPPHLDFWPWSRCGSRMGPVQSFVFLGLLVFELEPMYATSDRQTGGRTDGRTTDANHRLMPHPLRGGGIIKLCVCVGSSVDKLSRLHISAAEIVQMRRTNKFTSHTNWVSRRIHEGGFINRPLNSAVDVVLSLRWRVSRTSWRRAAAAADSVNMQPTSVTSSERYHLTNIFIQQRPSVCPFVSRSVGLRGTTNYCIRPTSDRIGQHRPHWPRRKRRQSIPRVWNRLPADLRQLRSTQTFRRHLKTFLFAASYWAPINRHSWTM